ncbi:pentapeptide repeat-containing protein [Calothrix sp. NIES-3974]|uniref:pentapeptide repeat-containing protein n=1 Tax=Calothrix sp. NIES-3974 TaxID=2005462 RepID=UPI000B615087|nr:pentapeptide repeat-containing protein [Calothrix sp. NIES-3974]BAZ07583.1 pentapeptide repeat-containing protein [Calothrix sp. NIES-3974]
MLGNWQGFFPHSRVKSRLSNAVSHLQDDAIAVRVMAIACLEAILRDYPQYYGEIMKILAQFIGDRTPMSKSQGVVCEDVQAALGVIGHNQVRSAHQSELIDLSYGYFRGVNLEYCNFAGVNFYQADFSGACLRHTNLQGAILSAANFSNANLEYANLMGANLGAANLTQTNCRYADLTAANLYLVKLLDTDFSGANLTQANLHGVDLSLAKIQNLESKI